MPQLDKNRDVRALLDELYAQDVVPPGNPIADYYQQRADMLGTGEKAALGGAGLLGGIGLSELLDGNPLALLLLAGAGGSLAIGAGQDSLGKERQATADMWFNRFGNNDPNQGLPGSPSGPAYRRR